MFKRGDSVIVTSDNYAEPDKDFTGMTGTVTGTDDHGMVAIQPDNQNRRLGFGTEELGHKN